MPPPSAPLSLALGANPRQRGGGVALAVCVRLKNEAIYLQEWLEFHLIAGVGHFYIFDDSSTDGTVALLRPYVDRGLVTLQVGVDHSHDAQHGQFGHRDQCIADNPANASWIAMIDADEFLFPSEGLSVVEHMERHCGLGGGGEQLSFLMLRWHMFGSNGQLRRPSGLVVDHYRMHQRLDETGCPAKQMGCFEQSPPLSTKLIVNTQCVTRVGTHYATELHPEATARGCRTIYTPLHSKETTLVAPRSGGFQRPQGRSSGDGRPDAKALHRACAAPLHLNHYAVKSREDYLAKFQRGRISRGDQDLKEGLAYRNETTGQVGGV